MPDIVWKIMAWLFVVGSWYAFVLLIRDLWRLISTWIDDWRLRRIDLNDSLFNDELERWQIPRGGDGQTYSD